MLSGTTQEIGLLFIRIPLWEESEANQQTCSINSQNLQMTPNISVPLLRIT